MSWWRNKDSALVAAWCMNSLAYSIVYPFLPIYLYATRGMPMSQVGLIFPMMGLGAMLGPPISGWLVDRLGRSRMLWMSTAGRGAIFVGLALLAAGEAPFWSFALLLTASSLTGAFFQVAADAYLCDLTTAAERPRSYSRIRVGTNVGWALGPMLGSFCAALPFGLLFLLTAALCGVSAWHIRKRCPEVAHHAVERQSGAAFSLGDMVRHREFILLAGTSFVLMMLMSQLYSTLSVYATTTAGISKNQLGWIYSVNGLTVIACQVAATALLDRGKVAFYARMALGATLYFVGYFGFALAMTPLRMMLCVVVLSLGEVVVQPALYAVVSLLAPAGARGRYMGVLGMARGVAYSLGPYLGALIFQQYATRPVLLWGILASPGLVAAAIFYRNRRKR